MNYLKALIYVIVLFFLHAQELNALRGKKKEKYVLPNYDDIFLRNGGYKIILPHEYVDSKNLNESLLRMIKITRNKFKKIKKSKTRLRDNCYHLGLHLGLRILHHLTVLSMRIMNLHIKEQARRRSKAKNKNLPPS
ncbi:hypothetical protein PKNA1_C2_1402500 [Plasmodium knowlesi strain H]|uniref:Uncharacterized protein n=3 Tax=Plasmodium knowlesi TaxID=5850 RepID=A0A1A7VVA0_PLAKH|nr:uncharacterized protein PKNH_1402500 [Plasmodium knowlesi strain H]OTN64016.1 Uncharacterized protein PKNOH_S140219600 [Plasmodium knowlesi]CAA9990624.1 hypothetical protein PKNH_1402500 [Plasmodium knowlesi strain H]SBO26036.1 hypothetical protein PKNA1_C2_1402500 [Plasmodium knowlesi strain H]SBO28734.1 hypothetical protein PKNA1_H1_1402500 [Plasmodium knowlesi strain H]VVS80098.1 hypothetical protein PKNH_1402500 [Plasmodium knowlesi strain H]